MRLHRLSLKAILKKARLFYDTVKYLKPVQVYGRIVFTLYCPQFIKRCKNPSRRTSSAVTAEFIKKSQRFFPPAKFSFLNNERIMPGLISWDDRSFDKLWRYNLHYFDDLTATGFKKRQQALINLIDQWIDANPFGKGTGWEPYPLSIRIVNWVKWDINTKALSGRQIKSLFDQAQWLERRVEHHLKGNHLIANAKALIFAGGYFSGDLSEGWLKQGLNILRVELEEQILEDGGHFERSPMYHNIVTEDLMDLLLLSKLYPNIVPAQDTGVWRAKVEKMVGALDVMVHPDGEIAFFNDSAFGVAPAASQLKLMAQNLDIPTLNTSGLKQQQTLPFSGYYKLCRSNLSLIIDAGEIGPDYLPAHAHADTLSFELSVGRKRLFVNSGTSLYGNSDERLHQRKTASHNTVTVDGCDSSEVWSGFRVAKRAKITHVDMKLSQCNISLSAAHDGFRRLNGNIDHQRTWHLGDDYLTIIDNISGKGHHQLCLYYYLHPDFTIVSFGDDWFQIRETDGRVPAKMKMDPSLDVTLADGKYHPQFGMDQKNVCIKGEKRAALPVQFVTNIKLLDGRDC